MLYEELFQSLVCPKCGSKLAIGQFLFAFGSCTNPECKEVWVVGVDESGSQASAVSWDLLTNGHRH